MDKLRLIRTDDVIIPDELAEEWEDIAIKNTTAPLDPPPRPLPWELIEYCNYVGLGLYMKSIFHRAAYYGCLDTIMSFAVYNIDIHKLNPEKALCLAAQQGHTQIVKYLIHKNVDVSCRNGFPLAIACRNGHLKIVKILLAHGADPDMGHCKPIHNAIYQQNNSIMDVLMLHGADTTCILNELMCGEIIAGYSGYIAEHIKRGANINFLNGFPLRLAVAKGHHEIVKELLLHGADPEVKRNAPLTMAIESGRLDIANSILEAIKKKNKLARAKETAKDPIEKVDESRDPEKSDKRA